MLLVRNVRPEAGKPKMSFSRLTISNSYFTKELVKPQSKNNVHTIKDYQTFTGINIIRSYLSNTQKQPSRGVLRKRCSENGLQIYRRTPMPRFDFNKVALQKSQSYSKQGVNLCCSYNASLVSICMEDRYSYNFFFKKE